MSPAAPLFMMLVVLATAACEPRTQRRSRERAQNPIEKLLRLPADVRWEEGVAVAVLIDTSGSMKERVADAGGGERRKLDIARETVVDMVRQLREFSEQHPERNILLGVYEFSSRDRQPSCRRLVELGRADPAAAATALLSLEAEGGTPIGNAMIEAKRDLDATGLSRRHILVVTDGESNKGYRPEAVADVIARQSEADRASIYFVAFDIDARRFDAVRDAGGLVLAAANETDLRQTLDFVLTGRILAEQPFEAPSPETPR